MADQKENSYRLLWMLGLALTLPMIFLSGPLAGFIISQLLISKFQMPGILAPVLTVLGLVGSGMQVFLLIRKLIAAQKKEDS